MFYRFPWETIYKTKQHTIQEIFYKCHEPSAMNQMLWCWEYNAEKYRNQCCKDYLISFLDILGGLKIILLF